MNLIIVVAIGVILFGLAFLSKRRFGMHGLALAAGATLASLWGNDAGVLLASAGVLPPSIAADALALCLVTVLPALLLLTRGKKYKKVGSRVVGSLLFTILALAFIVQPLSSVLPLDATGVVIYTTLLQYQSLIISGGIVLAIIDILMAKAPKPAPEEKHRH